MHQPLALCNRRFEQRLIEYVRACLQQTGCGRRVSGVLDVPGGPRALRGAIFEKISAIGNNR
jgi:hypothetical protein